MNRALIPLCALLLPVAACGPAEVGDEQDLEALGLEVDDALTELDADVQAEGAETVALSLDLDESLFPADDVSRRAAIRQVLLDRAAEEPCEIGGIVAGRYSNADLDLDLDEDGIADADGGFRLIAFEGRTEPIASALGAYRAFAEASAPDGSAAETNGGELAGRWVSENGGHGTLNGEYDGADRRRVGTVEASWEQVDGEGFGNLAGVWHGVRHRDGGVFLGYWSDCDAS
jgi:hypothetical protein